MAELIKITDKIAQDVLTTGNSFDEVLASTYANEMLTDIIPNSKAQKYDTC